MKFKFYLILFFLISAILLFFIVPSEIKFNSIEIDEIRIVTYPSPPKYKIVTGRSDINQVVELLNNLKLTKMLFNNEKGWQVIIQLDKKEILVNEYYIKINNIWYKSSENVTKLISPIYTQLNYEENYWR